MATLSEIKNNVHIIEMEISHLHKNSYYYIINYNKIYIKRTVDDYISRYINGLKYTLDTLTKKENDFSDTF